VSKRLPRRPIVNINDAMNLMPTQGKITDIVKIDAMANYSRCRRLTFESALLENYYINKK